MQTKTIQVAMFFVSSLCLCLSFTFKHLGIILIINNTNVKLMDSKFQLCLFLTPSDFQRNTLRSNTKKR